MTIISVTGCLGGCCLRDTRHGTQVKTKALQAGSSYEGLLNAGTSVLFLSLFLFFLIRHDAVYLVQTDAV